MSSEDSETQGSLSLFADEAGYIPTDLFENGLVQIKKESHIYNQLWRHSLDIFDLEPYGDTTGSIIQIREKLVSWKVPLSWDSKTFDKITDSIMTLATGQLEPIVDENSGFYSPNNWNITFRVGSQDGDDCRMRFDSSGFKLDIFSSYPDFETIIIPAMYPQNKSQAREYLFPWLPKRNGVFSGVFRSNKYKIESFPIDSEYSYFSGNAPTTDPEGTFHHNKFVYMVPVDNINIPNAHGQPTTRYVFCSSHNKPREFRTGLS